jgi:hypothetical protein
VFSREVEPQSIEGFSSIGVEGGLAPNKKMLIKKKPKLVKTHSIQPRSQSKPNSRHKQNVIVYLVLCI